MKDGVTDENRSNVLTTIKKHVQAIEWVHCHLARRPMAPAERKQGIPGAVSAILMKLLAKSAEDRYQTAAGLERDLLRCQTEWEAQRRIDEFPLGQHDTRDWLLIPEKLYGRRPEVETLLASFDHVVSGGAAKLVLVSGYSGIGKSSVVGELPGGSRAQDHHQRRYLPAHVERESRRYRRCERNRSPDAARR